MCIQDTYFQRAQSWIDSADDVTETSLMKTINRISFQLVQERLNGTTSKKRLEDLDDTISLLNETLLEQYGISEERASDVTETRETNLVQEDGNWVFDPSPLINDAGVPQLQLTQNERKILIDDIVKRGLVQRGL